MARKKLTGSFLALFAVVGLVTLVWGCGESEQDNQQENQNDDAAKVYSLSGDVLVGMGQFEDGYLILQNVENGDEVTIDWSGDSYQFEFPTLLADGEDYSISVEQSPPDWSCSPFDNTNGTIDGEDVDDIEIECYNTDAD